MMLADPIPDMTDTDHRTRFGAMRAAMIQSQLRTNEVDDVALIAAIDSVAREDFVTPDRRLVAYADSAQPLGGGRALNMPLVTARLLDAAAIRPGHRVLIVGAATGYAGAIAMRLGAEVVMLESDAALADRARDNVPGATVVTGPLPEGHAAAAPYDVILIDGGVETIPDAFAAQLASDGRIVTAIVEQGVTRLAVGRAAAGSVRPVPFADAAAVILPGFARPQGFRF